MSNRETDAERVAKWLKKWTKWELIDDQEFYDAANELLALLGEGRQGPAACPGCLREDPVLLDEDGTFAEISGLPGRFGHAVDDYWWYCDQYSPVVHPPQGERERLKQAFITGFGYGIAEGSNPELRAERTADAILGSESDE